MMPATQKGRNRIAIDYDKCGDGHGVDPRSCGLCLRICDPAVFLLHQTLNVEDDPKDPRLWRVSPYWTDLCSRCMKCAQVCPQKAITVTW
jgi:NAD-dependent dihydropyrimidine dehydrogenase PreA subunit